MFGDLRFALRSLWKNKSFTAIALCALALGIGANSALFSVFNAVLLHAVPFDRPDELVMVWTWDPRESDGRVPITPADYQDWRAQSHSFQGMAAGSDVVYTLTGGGDPEMILGYGYEPAMFPLLGMKPDLGRFYTAEDGDHVVVLSHALWQRRFGGDPQIVGRAITLDQKSYRVVGVMPKAFNWLGSTQLWTPLVIPPELAHSRDQSFLRVTARLRPGVTVEQARTEMRAIAARQRAAWPDTNRYRDADIETAQHLAVGDIRPTLLVLLGAVAFVLLLACSNVASLLFARAAARQREIAIRVALGAGRGRIIRQLLTESLLLAVLAGGLGLLVALWGVSFLVHMFPQKLGNVSIPRIDHLPIDGAVLMFTLAVSIATGVVFGLVPAISASRIDIERALREGRAGSPHGARLRRFLVAGEIALAVVLTAGASLMAESFARIANEKLGFVSAGVHTGRVILPQSRYPDHAKQYAFVRDVLEKLRGQPGVEEAGCTTTLPLSGWWSDTSFHVEGTTDEVKAGWQVADPAYFATMRIPLLRGRMFDSSDVEGAPAVILVDDELAHRYFPGRDPVGQRMNFGSPDKPEWRRIIGVVGDVRAAGPAQPRRPTVYAPFSQRYWPLLGFVVRGGDAGSVRAAVWAVDPNQPVSYSMTMDEMVADALTLRRVTMIVLLAFAALALGLAAMGIYGVMAFAVVQRTHEIGVRMALGARRTDVVTLVLRQALRLVLIGIAVGLPAALLLSRTLASQLYGVGSADPLAFSATLVVLSAVALLAAWLPARRATRIDPMVALRGD